MRSARKAAGRREGRGGFAPREKTFILIPAIAPTKCKSPLCGYKKNFVRRPIIYLLIPLATLALLGCGGSAPTPPAPAGNFSNASLKGQYAFLLSGVAGQTGAYTARIGSFTADGAGSITAGLADALNLSSASSASTISYTGGSYTIQANGRGVISLQSASGNLSFSVALQSASAGSIIETDLAAATGGTLRLQTPASFTAGSLSSPYVFEFSGVTFVPSAAAPISLIGEFQTNGAGAITGGVLDTDNGNLTPSGATPIAGGTYALDATSGATFGRGTMSFGGYSFAFYIVDATHLLVLEEDTLGGMAGDALQQAASVPTQNSQFTGSFVYQLGGAFVRNAQGPIARVARFTADGNGGLGSVSLDTNYDGSYTHSSSASSATYAIDASNSGSGRGTFTFTASGNATTYVFYLISPTQALLQEVTPGVVAGGPLNAQAAGPFSQSSLTGNFVFRWVGVQLGASTTIPLEENFVGQYAGTSSSSGNVTGATDYVQLGLSGSTVFDNVPLGGTLTINGDGTINNHYKFAVNGSPSVTINFQAYFVDPTTLYLVTSDGNRTTTGIISQQ